MILDERTEFADATVIPTPIANANVGDVVDLGATPARDIGNGEPVYINFQISTSVTSAGAATVQFHVVSDAVNPPDISTRTVHASSTAFSIAQLVASSRFQLALPFGSSYEQYLGVQAEVAVAVLTAGAVDAFLTLDPSGWTAYPDAQN